MYKIVFFSTVIFFAKVVYTQVSPSIAWQNTIGGTDYDLLTFLQQTADGGYILAGFSDSDISGDKTENELGETGYNDYWIVKLDSAGNIEWQNTIGGEGDDYYGIGDDKLYRIQQTIDGGYILGGYSNSGATGDKTEPLIDSLNFSYDYWIAKTDSSGNIQWDKTLGGYDNDYLQVISQTPDGGYILGGTSNSDSTGDKTENNIGEGNAYTDYWVVKLDSEGNIEWDNTIGGTDNDKLYDIEQTVDNGYVVAGSSWSDISGDKTENSKGVFYEADYWIVKLNSTGEIVYDKTIGGAVTDILTDIEVTDENDIMLGGYSDSDISGDKTQNSIGADDYWIVLTDSGGIIQWDKTIGGASNELLRVVKQASDEGFLIAGSSYSDSSGNKTENSMGASFESDFWIVKTDASGNILWDNTIGGDADDALFNAQQTADAGYILGGASKSGITGDKAENNIGNYDYWVIKLSADCSLTMYYADADADGYGDTFTDTVISACDPAPVGYITDHSDCNDMDDAIYPAAAEICNSADDNCNGEIDEGLDVIVLFLDADEDNFGDVSNDTATCVSGIAGYTSDSSDCDDLNPLVYPGAPEIADGVDNNCNDIIDEGVVSITSLENALSVNIFPNPATWYFTLEINALQLDDRKIKICIINIFGEELLNRAESITNGKLSETIFLEQKKGIYIVKIYDGKDVYEQKIIIL